MGAFDRFLCAAAIALAAVAGCARLASETDRPCPCAEGFVCCPTTHTCRQENECPPPAADADAANDSTVDRGDRDAASSPDVASADTLDGSVRADSSLVQSETDAANDSTAEDSSSDARDAAVENVRDACDPDAPTGPQIISSGFLDLGMTETDRFYSGQFQLDPCTHLTNGNASASYAPDNNDIPPVTSGLTIFHTFEPAGPYMTPPATQPPGKYSISQVSLAYDAVIDTYTWSFFGTNYSVLPCMPGPTCTAVDGTWYRVVIDVAQ